MKTLIRATLFVAFLLALGVVSFAASSTSSPAPRVKIDSGVVEGVPPGHGLSAAAFMGIPYAAPPTGNLRWKPPQPVASWRGVRDVKKLGPSCPQEPERYPRYWKVVVSALGGDPAVVPPLGPTSEDCLFLNVWTSNLGGKKKQPVMVWIHGGGFGNRGGDEASVLANDGAVVVTINYRLGTLGLLAHPALTKESPNGSSGNYCLLDQIEALRWVQRNIAAFGGDPNRVTVFGHSFGSGAVHYLLSSPLAQGLFQRAIMQSGAPTPSSSARTLSSAEASGQKFVKALGLAEEDPIPALRAASVDKLLSIPAEPYMGFVTDEWVVSSRGAERSAQVPLIIGASANEVANQALLFPQSMPKDHEAYQALVKQVGPPWSDRLLAMYPADNDAAVQGAAIKYLTDRQYVCASRHIAAKRGGLTWLYFFSAATARTPDGKQLGAFHGSDLRLMFNLEYGVPIGDAGKRVGETMRRYWVQFAATGDPNQGGLPKWPPYEGTKPQHLEVGDPIRSTSGPVRESCDIFDEAWSQ